MELINSRLRAIVFDFGGVLLEWDPRNLYRLHFENEIIMEKFLDEINFYEWNARLDQGRPFTEGVAELSGQFPQYKDLIHLFHHHWVKCVGQPIKGTVELLLKLKTGGWRVYGLSNWSSETFPIVKSKFQFFDVLDGYMISGDVNLIKPDPAIFRLFLSNYGYLAEECLFIDDSLRNVEIAHQLGFPTIRFQSPEQLERELQSLNLV